MKDKETKEWIREQIEGIEAYDYSATTNGIMEAIERLEQEAERRGAISLYKELDDLDIMLAMLHSVEDTNDEEVHKIVGNIRNELKKTLDKLKLLEEENGKQNAR